MRWTNYFIHPGDNRYYVFTFREKEHADAFQSQLDAAAIEYEPHEEDGQRLFGIHRNHFTQALRCNHLVHARYRTKFIPVRGLRYALLIGTGAVLMLAIIGALTQSAKAQTTSIKWELGVSALGVLPLEVLGYEALETSDEGLTLQWQPQLGSGFGVRMQREFNSAWHVQTGLETVRMRSDWLLTFAPENEAFTLSDTLSLRAGRYRMPVLAVTKVPLNQRWELFAGGGLSLDFLLSDVFTTGYQQEANFYNEYQVEENRQHRWTVPLRAEFGAMYRPADRNRAGLYLGCIWWREWSSNRWGEAQWERMLEKASVRLFMPQAGFALEARIILPP